MSAKTERKKTSPDLIVSAKAAAISPTLGTLLKKLDKEPGVPQSVPVGPEDIGGELLPLLSKGLYTNPLDSIREYVQNSVDAKAHNVRIMIAGSAVQIYDDGDGMGVEDILRARQFGLSAKSIKQHVGFRGIGIYSAFDLCQRLMIRSRRATDTHTSVLSFDFEAMRRDLDTDRAKDSGQPKTSITDLLSRHTSLTREPEELPAGTKFTSVELQDVSDTHLRQLSNRKEMRKYLLQNLPIDFADSFPYATKIRNHLQAHVPGYNAVRVTLQAEGQKDEVVAKYADEDLSLPGDTLKLQHVTFRSAKNAAKQTVAVIWACLNSERSRLRSKPPKKFTTYFDLRPDYEGFVYKVKGFTIGERPKLLSTFQRKPQVYPWYTGEVYVVDPDVIPNAARHDFETNQARRALDMAVLTEMGELEKEAEKFQARSVAEERLAEYRAEVDELRSTLDNDERPEDFNTYSRLDEIAKDLKRQKGQLADPGLKSKADDLLKEIDALQKKIKKMESEAARRAERAKKGKKGNSDSSASDSHEGSAGKTSASKRSGPRSLLDVLDELGWDLETDVGEFAEAVQESVEAVLGFNSEEYRRIVAGIEARISNVGVADDD